VNRIIKTVLALCVVSGMAFSSDFADRMYVSAHLGFGFGTTSFDGENIAKELDDVSQ